MDQTRRRAWILGSLVFLFAFVLFPLRSELLNPPDRARVFQAPDTTPQWWTPELLAERFVPLSASQRAFYGWSEVTLDLVFPALYAALLILALRLVWRGPHAVGKRRLWQTAIILVPTLAAVADLCENAVLAGAAWHFPWALGKGGATVLSLAGKAKFGLLLAAFLLLLLALSLAGRLGRTVALLWLVRIPLLGLCALVMLAVLGGSDQVSQTIPNMMLMSGFLQMFLVALLAGIVANSAGFSLMLIWDYGDERTGSELPALPLWVASQPTGSAYRGAPLIVLALPLVVCAIARSIRGNGQSLVAMIAAAVLGLVAALLLIPLIEWMRRQLIARSQAAFGESVREGLIRAVGKAGYLSPEGKFYPGHLFATAGLITGGLIYIAANMALRPAIDAVGAARVPTLAYVLGLLAVLVGLLSGASFLVDRWRAPLLVVLVLWATIFGFFSPIRHEFEATWKATPLPSVGEAARARLRAQGDGASVLTLVTATGGGIQAAAWTARVVTGLDEELGGRFSPTIGVISSTSGGSVGSYFLLSAFGPAGGLEPGHYAAVVEASEASSLEETAWGFLFPDLRRAFLPFSSSVRDRAWAMEQGWMRARLQAGLGTSKDAIKGETLISWYEGAARGRLPAVVFNATRIDDGGPLRLATVRSAQAGHPRGQVRGLTAADGYSLTPTDPECSETPGFLNLSTATAARLSATFPYISPITVPEVQEKLPCLERWHAGDGGYFDNHGMTGALSWWADLQRECSDCLKQVEHIVWLQIDPFPESENLAQPGKGGWVESVAGPLLGLLRVRTGSQRFRRDQELALLESLEPRLHVVTLSPPPPDEGVTRDPPLSWFLSPSDKRRVEEDWQKVRQGEEIGRLKGFFLSGPGASSPAE